MKRTLLIALAAGLSITAASTTAAGDEPAHALLNAAEIKWGEAPPVFPPGAKMAVLYGDQGKAGMFIVRVKIPAGFVVPAHWHSNDEVVSIVSGSAGVGLGDKFDRSKLHTLTAGGFVIAPARHNHYLASKAGAVIQVAANGPFDMTYVDPKDDPRNRPK